MYFYVFVFLTATPGTGYLVKIVVPVLIVLIAIAVILGFFWWKKRKNSRRYLVCSCLLSLFLYWNVLLHVISFITHFIPLIISISLFSLSFYNWYVSSYNSCIVWTSFFYFYFSVTREISVWTWAGGEDRNKCFRLLKWKILFFNSIKITNSENIHSIWMYNMIMYLNIGVKLQ